MLPQKIERQLAFMEAHPEYGISTHDMEVFDSLTGRKLYFTDERFRPPTPDWRGVFATNWFFGRQMKSIPSSILARREFLTAAFFDERFRICNEWLHMIECLARTGLKWGHLGERLGRYRIHDSQLHSSPEANRNSFAETMALLDLTARRYPRLAVLARRKRDFTYFEHLFYGWFPASELSKREIEFRREAGWLKWVYLRFCRAYKKRRGLFEATRPLRKWVERFAAR